MTCDDASSPTRSVTVSRRFLLGSSALAAVAANHFAGARRASAAQSAEAAPRFPFPQHRIYASGTIRPNHRTQDQQDDDVRAAYDRWKANYVVADDPAPDGTPTYRIVFAKAGTGEHEATVSEGQGFGMITVAHLAGHDPNAQAIFDGLWRYTRAHPSEIDSRLMDWKQPLAEGNDSAFDGDCDMAYALLLADAQWGSDGAIPYRAAAEELLAGILESTIGAQSRLPMLGDWVDPDGPDHNQYTPRTSDFMPGHFRAFARATGDPVWNDVAAVCQTVVSILQTNHSPDTGLLPDFVQPVSATDHTPRPADPDFLEGPRDGQFAYNAGRDPWRLGTDALLNADAASLSQVSKIALWAAAATQGDPTAIRAGYALDGTPLPDSDYFTTFFAAPLGVAAMTVQGQQQWLNDLYDTVVDRSENYYEDSVTLLCLLVMTGNFWDPTTA